MLFKSDKSKIRCCISRNNSIPETSTAILKLQISPRSSRVQERRLIKWLNDKDCSRPSRFPSINGPKKFQGHVMLRKPFGPVELRKALMQLSG